MNTAQYENTRHRYGACPSCGQSCQPERVNLNDDSLEYVVCCDCRIIWYLHHTAETDRRHREEGWSDYRIGDVQTFADFGALPYECKERD